MVTNIAVPFVRSCITGRTSNEMEIICSVSPKTHLRFDILTFANVAGTHHKTAHTSTDKVQSQLTPVRITGHRYSHQDDGKNNKSLHNMFPLFFDNNV
jgi:hypothetical protein